MPDSVERSSIRLAEACEGHRGGRTSQPVETLTSPRGRTALSLRVPLPYMVAACGAFVAASSQQTLRAYGWAAILAFGLSALISCFAPSHRIAMRGICFCFILLQIYRLLWDLPCVEVGERCRVRIRRWRALRELRASSQFWARARGTGRSSSLAG